MKLQCSVSVWTSSGLTGAQRLLKSTLALAAEPNKPNSYCILHFSSLNKTGRRYKVNDNIAQVFVKFCNEGKATIKFKDPPHDLHIQSDPVQLKVFLKTLKDCLQPNSAESKIPHISSVSVTSKDTAPTKLVVLDIGDYPNKGFPRTLNHLQISGLRMCNFKRDILMLRNLKVLNLSNNRIEKLPEDMGDMSNLAELHLNENNLGSSSYSSWKWINRIKISKQLKLLDLSSNNLNFIPHSICKLKNLVTLKLNKNHLSNLPNGIGTMKSLRYLSASDNNLRSLPASILSLRLEQVDLSSNPLENYEIKTEKVQAFKVNSLVDIASTYVLKYRLYYASDIIPFTLVDYLDNTKYCICGAPTLNYVNYIKCLYSLKSFCATIISDGKYNVNFDCYLCSYSCYRKYFSRKRPREGSIIL